MKAHIIYEDVNIGYNNTTCEQVPSYQHIREQQLHLGLDRCGISFEGGIVVVTLN